MPGPRNVCALQNCLALAALATSLLACQEITTVVVVTDDNGIAAADGGGADGKASETATPSDVGSSETAPQDVETQQSIDADADGGLIDIDEEVSDSFLDEMDGVFPDGFDPGDGDPAGVGDGANKSDAQPPVDGQNSGGSLLTCDQYCKAVMNDCTADNSQFVSTDDCVNYCKVQGKIPVGLPGDVTGNTIGCRITHANMAAKGGSNAATQCTIAGPTGGNVCGSWCDIYCQMALTNCNADTKLFNSLAQCPAQCEQIATTGKPGATSGDSVQCRIYQLGIAGSDQATSKIYCPHAKVLTDPGSPCSDQKAPPPPTCSDYCQAVTTGCIGEFAQYVSNDACLNYCQTQAKIPVGGAGDVGVNTIGCRLSHANAAVKDASVAPAHCAAAGPTGSDVCGSWCDNYCWLAKSNCTGANALYATDLTCKNACGPMKNNGSPGAIAGDSVQCRMSELALASSNPSTLCNYGKSPSPTGSPCVDPKKPKTWSITTTADYIFAPSELTITVGDSISFTPGGSHNVTQVDEATWLANATTPTDGGFSIPGFGNQVLQFLSAGEVWFICTNHADAGEKGHISVQ